MTDFSENPTGAAWAAEPLELSTDVVDVSAEPVAGDPEHDVIVIVEAAVDDTPVPADEDGEQEEQEASDVDADAEQVPRLADVADVADLEDLRAELEAERARVAERAASLAPLLERAGQHREEVEALRSSLAEKDLEIDGLRADLAAARAQVGFERERLGAEIERVRNETADEREHIVAVKERLRTEIERLRRDRVWLDGELQQLAVERRRLEVLSASLDDLHARLQADRARVIDDLARLGSFPSLVPSDEGDGHDPDEDAPL